MTNNLPNFVASTPALPTRPAWAGPLFLLGLGALVWVLFQYGSSEDRRTRRFQRDLDMARHLLFSSPENHADEVVHRARQVLNEMEPAHPLAGEAWFLSGVALLEQVKKASPNLKAGLLAEAITSLERSQELGVREEDKPGLTWQLARAQWTQGNDPRPTLVLLEKAAPGAEDVAMAWQLIEEGYLKLNPPDLTGALRANEQIRSTPLIAEERRAQAQLNGGEILMKLNQMEEARRTLEKVSFRASPASFQKAKLSLAKGYQDEARWGEAATQWQRYLTEAKPPTHEAAVGYLMLGQCQAKLEQFGDAAKSWQEARKIDKSEASLAASAYWAELRSMDAGSDPTASAEAAAAFEALLAQTGPNLVWNNRWLNAKSLSLLMERTLSNFRGAGQVDLAIQLAATLDRVAPPGTALQYKAELLAEKARLVNSQVTATDPASQKAKNLAVASLLRESALALELSAVQITDPNQKSDQLWKAVGRSREAKDNPLAERLLQAFLTLMPRGEKTGEAWYLLGESQRELNKAALASTSYANSTQFMTPFQYRSRLRLAQELMAKKEGDKAVETLEQNLQLLRFDPDVEAQRDSLYVLGGLFAEQGKWHMAARRLEEAIERFPNNSGSIRARLQLAEGYRHIAEDQNANFMLGERVTADTRAHFQKEYRRWLEKALETYLEVEKLGQTPEGLSQLTAQDQLATPFAIADCRFNLGKYADALAGYTQLAKRNAGTREGLHAMGGVVRCHSALSQFDQVKSGLEELTLAIRSVDEPTRKEWEGWIRLASRPIPATGANRPR